MGISFKVSKTGRRFRPEPLQSESRVEQDGMVIDDSGENQRTRGKIESGSRKQVRFIYRIMCVCVCVYIIYIYELKYKVSASGD